jgi:hypothetical protein
MANQVGAGLVTVQVIPYTNKIFEQNCLESGGSGRSYVPVLGLG